MKVIYFDIDSLRPDHLGVYGYKRPTSPNIDQVARDGIVFQNCFASDSPCMPSRAATISGRFGARTGIVTHGPRGETMDLKVDTLPNILRAAGVTTAAVSTFGRHPSPWFYVGWENFYDPKGWHFQATPAWKINEIALDWLDDHAKDDFFLWVQYWDVHSVYNPPESCVDAVKSDDYPEYPTKDQVHNHRNDVFWHSAGMMGIDSYETYKHMVDLYDAEIRYVDYHIGQVLKKLDSLGISEDTAIIISADHGEELGEHGVYIEHWSVYDGTNRVPLIVRLPKALQQSGVRHDLVYQMDLSATILDLFGVRVPEKWDAKSLLSGDSRTHLVCGHGLYTAQRAVITENWKLIRTYHPGQWDIPNVQLFDRKHDVFEQHSVVHEHRGVVKELMDYLTDWESRVAGETDPMKVNALYGPPGIQLYGQQAMEAYEKHRRVMDFVLPDRKPSIDP
ncbi:sulfatase family protein [Alicyclobacillus shizuokensis]|uniref:sulfatase family protein n=1 Tax=Alicyclobacillus shizuokensis TaxID=392014 RepID=UPI0009FB089C|nr:sulfatase [Alicyclobacillus shizuokensis]MCL6625765.1 sulfatase-like hydrolase/transferase [Alicyclobacillus shizuokensis]